MGFRRPYDKNDGMSRSSWVTFESHLIPACHTHGGSGKLRYANHSMEKSNPASSNKLPFFISIFFSTYLINDTMDEMSLFIHILFSLHFFLSIAPLLLSLSPHSFSLSSSSYLISFYSIIFLRLILLRFFFFLNDPPPWYGEEWVVCPCESYIHELALGRWAGRSIYLYNIDTNMHIIDGFISTCIVTQTYMGSLGVRNPLSLCVLGICIANRSSLNFPE